MAGRIKVGPAWTMRPLKRVTLEKVADAAGLPVGFMYDYTYKSLADHDALHRAWLALKRDHPEENPVNWKKMK